MKAPTVSSRWRALFATCLLVACAQSNGQPSLSLRFTNSAPELTLTGTTGAVCQVQYADSLPASSNWFCLTNFTLTTNPLVVPDDGWGGATQQRFYRALAVAPNMALVPGGSFLMGDSFGDLGADEVPVHTATVSGFYMDRMEVSKALWSIVHSWATNHGYDFSANASLAKAITHPVTCAYWYDAVKWCNAR